MRKTVDYGTIRYPEVKLQVYIINNSDYGAMYIRLTIKQYVEIFLQVRLHNEFFVFFIQLKTNYLIIILFSTFFIEFI